MAFLGTLLSAGLPLLGNILKSVAPKLIENLPAGIKGIASAVLPGLVDSGVKAIERGVSTPGSLGDKLSAGTKKFASSTLKTGEQVLKNVNRDTERRLINNQTPVYTRGEKASNKLDNYEVYERKKFLERLDKLYKLIDKRANVEDPNVRIRVIVDDLNTVLKSWGEKGITKNELDDTGAFDKLKNQFKRKVEEMISDPNKNTERTRDMIEKKINKNIIRGYKNELRF